MKTILLFAFIILSATTTQATNYYFSSVSGDDSRTAVQAKNPATPWKTLSKLNSYFSSLLPGDSVLLKRGETFYGSITVKKSGTSSAPIVIGAYGSGNKPVISGMAMMTDWVSKGNGIYESVNSALSTSVNMVVINGDIQQIGRYPNADAPSGGYLFFESHSGSTAITDDQLNSSINWAGAEIVVRQRHWKLDRATIKSISGNTITNTGLSGEPYDNYGYFIQDDIRTLDRQGEWYYNPSTKKLNVFFGTTSPSSYTVEASAVANIIFSDNYSNIQFDNLTIRGGNEDGINISNGSNMQVTNCDIIFSGINGIDINYSSSARVENCSVLNSNNNGIDLSGDDGVVSNNKVYNTSAIAGMGLSGDGTGMGINTRGNNTLIQFNDVRNTGYIPIYFRNDYTIVKNNYIDNFCFVKDDGAGIYTFTGGDAPPKGRKVIGNIILNGMGAGAGTSDDSGAAQGIYMDVNASSVEIRSNTVANTVRGIYLHSAHEITLKNNTLFNNKINLYMKQDDGLDQVRNNTITNNILFAKNPMAIISSIKSNVNDISSFGSFDSNYYARPLNDRLVITSSIMVSGVSVNKSLDLDGWKNQYNEDIASRKTSKQIEPYKISKLLTANTILNGNFAASITGVGYSACTISLAPSGILDGNSLKVVPTAKQSTISIKVGTVSAGKKYILRYSIKGTADNNMVLSSYLRQGVSPYNTLSTVIARKVTTGRTDHEILFIPTLSDAGAKLVFKADDLTAYYLDNIQFFEADAIVTNPDDSIRFEFNASNVRKSITLDGNYVDVKNNKYAGTITLDPYASAVLIRTNGTIQNTAPVVAITSPATNASFTSPASVVINATASDVDGSIAKVDFYNGTSLLGTSTSSPYTFTWNNVAAGNYSIVAKATDNGGLVTESGAVSISVVKPNVAPTVSITNPFANAEFVAPASVNITANANDSDGTIAKVDFYNGTTLLGSDNTSPYSVTFSNVAVGSYSITAKATDNAGLVGTSEAVTVSVIKANEAPTVSITSPAANASFTSPASISIAATAADADGSVSKVDFYNGTTLLGSDNTSPFSFTWSNVASGNYSIVAKATDNGGLVTESGAVSVSVIKPNVAPAVSITSPAANASFTSPASISISASATDADGSLSKVDFYNGTTLLGSDNTSPYTFTWSNVAAGNYSIVAKATDNGGLVTESGAVSVSVVKPNVAPTVSVTSPATNASFTSPASISITATAADADGSVSKVDFYNGTTLLGSDNTSPFSFTWSNVASGNYSIVAKATDNGGLVTESGAVSVSVVKPNVAPTVSITSPAANASFTSPASISIAATAADADGSVVKVDFYNGTTLLGSDNTSPYTYTIGDAAVGSYAITAKAIDNQGLVSVSDVVNVTVNANVAPTVSITNPLSGASVTEPSSINIAATATDADGSVSKVDFYNGSTFLGTDNTSPFTFTWNNVAAGNYSIVAKATDNGGLVTASASVNVSVIKANSGPTVSITSPAANASFTSPASISITATAADADGSVSKVDFYNGTTLLGSDNTSPYTFTWSNVGAGNYSIVAKATDNGGLVTESGAVSVSVVKPNVAPTVSITSPAANANFTAPASINITATAADEDGSVVKVDFYNGTTLLGTSTSSPYTVTWSNIAEGNYLIVAKATDNNGLVTESTGVSISVTKQPNVAPTVSITSPVADANFTAPASISIAATAADADGSVTKIDFYNGSVLLGTATSAPYTFTWSDAAAGNYSIFAKATDNEGAVTSSDAVNVSVTATQMAPTVSLIRPVADSSFTAPAAITISAEASDADGSVAKVEFYNGSTLLAVLRNAPYTWTWQNAPAGNYVITAKATDNDGLVSVSSSVSVSVSENVAPTVVIVSPTVNSAFAAPSELSIAAEAYDSDGSIMKVDFYNGTTYLGTDYTSPYTFNMTNVATGDYVLTAKATDNGGLVTSSAPVIVSVSNQSKAPFVNITNPVNLSSYKTPAEIYISANATDSDGTIQKVEFYAGNSLIGVQKFLPYSFYWKGVPAGEYTIVAKAYDNDGFVTSSSPVRIKVLANIAPTVKLTSPTATSKFAGPANIVITAEANDSDGKINRVEFYNGTKLLTTERYLPYSWKWQNVPAGTYTITAVAYDNNGLATKSAPVTVTVASAAAADVARLIDGDLAMLNDGYHNYSLNNSNAVRVKVGPNPASNVVSVFMNGLPKNKDLKISLVTMTGLELKTLSLNTSSQVMQLNIATLRPGLYLIKIIADGSIITRQFEKL